MSEDDVEAVEVWWTATRKPALSLLTLTNNSQALLELLQPWQLTATRRITKEYNDLITDPVENVTAAPEESNMLKWSGIIDGPRGTPYEGGHWKIAIDFPIDYPFKAPTVKFLTRIYHMNITDEGLLCIGLLKAEAWKPSTKINQILRSLVQLLHEPSPEDALVASISEAYQNDRKRHDTEAKAMTKRHAMK